MKIRMRMKEKISYRATHQDFNRNEKEIFPESHRKLFLSFTLVIEVHELKNQLRRKNSEKAGQGTWLSWKSRIVLELTAVKILLEKLVFD